MQWLSWRNPCLYLTWFLAEGGGLLCVGRLVFQKKTAPTPELATGGLQVATNFGISWAETWVNSKSEHCMAQKTWPGNGPPKDALAMSWVDTEMHQDILWLGPHIPASLVSNRFVLEDIAACTAPLARCFFSEEGSFRPIDSIQIVGNHLEVTNPKERKQRIWWHNPVHIVDVSNSTWHLFQDRVVTTIFEPTFWNGQDTSNIFHMLVSFIGRLWLHLRSNFPDTNLASLLYVFDLHAGRPNMFGTDGLPLIPGTWAEEFAQYAFPGMRITHVGHLAAQGPVLFRRLHFNLVNWGSWILPSEDLLPPRVSRHGVGPHPTLSALPMVVKASLNIDEAHSANRVLLIRRNPPAGRRLTNEAEFVEEMQANGLKVHVADLSLMNFAAQVEAVSRSSILVGAHGQGLFNLVFLPRSGAVVEVPPCGVPLALVYNVAELFGFAFGEILNTSCDSAFMANFTNRGCIPCTTRKIKTVGGEYGIDSSHVGDCERIPPECDVRSAQTLTLNDISEAAKVVREVRFPPIRTSQKKKTSGRLQFSNE